jgi:dihydroflavonol-4-reductase
MTLLQILRTIDEIQGRRRTRFNLPANLVLPAAWLMEKIATITHVEPAATVDGVRMAKKMMFYSSDKAVRELGYRFRPATEALRDATNWFQANGYCS